MRLSAKLYGLELKLYTAIMRMQQNKESHHKIRLYQLLREVVDKAEDVVSWFDHHIRSPYLNVKYGLSNLWAYKGLIWQDRDWDHYFLYTMLAFKLRRMGRLMVDYGNATVSKKHGTKALIAAECARRLAEYDRTLDDEWFDARVDGVDYRITFVRDPITGLYTSPEITKSNKYERLFKIAVKRQEKQRQFYKDLLYKLMNKYGDRWWD